MTNAATETRSVVFEREIPHPPEKLWRALTQPHLIAEWLMQNDFAPVVGHRFNLSGEWGGVLDCEVLAIEPCETLSYTWNFAHDDAAYNLQSVVTSRSRQRARVRTYAWSNRASGRIRSKPSAAPTPGGSSSSSSWSRSWRGPSEVFAFVIPDARSAIRNPGDRRAMRLPLGSGFNAPHCPGMTKAGSPHLHDRRLN